MSSDRMKKSSCEESAFQLMSKYFRGNPHGPFSEQTVQFKTKESLRRVGT